jgi:hypothetical protein
VLIVNSVGASRRESFRGRYAKLATATPNSISASRVLYAGTRWHIAGLLPGRQLGAGFETASIGKEFWQIASHSQIRPFSQTPV